MADTHDPKCHALAEAFLSGYTVLDVTGRNLEAEVRPRLVNSLANEIQGAIEGWLADTEEMGHITEAVIPPAPVPSKAVEKFCYQCRSWSMVWTEQTICPRCGHEGLREK